MEINFYDIEAAAAVLFLVNPTYHKSPQEIEAFIKKEASESLSRALENFTIPCFVACGGWMCNFYNDEASDVNAWDAHITLDASIILDFTLKATRASQ